MNPHLRLLVMSLALATVQLAQAEINSGTPGCPCIEWAGLDNYISEGCINFTPSEGMGTSTEDSFCYPVTYGSTECKVWDESLEPFCADASGNPLVNAPAWCLDSFCYVDPNNCDSIIGKSGMFPNEDLYYSYATCGADSSFENWLESGGNNLEAIAKIVEDYVISAVNTIESEIPSPDF